MCVCERERERERATLASLPFVARDDHCQPARGVVRSATSEEATSGSVGVE